MNKMAVEADPETKKPLVYYGFSAMFSWVDG